ncbi:hypothetical protein EMCRGX_G013977 [Ephydatia muelleri]
MYLVAKTFRGRIVSSDQFWSRGTFVFLFSMFIEHMEITGVSHPHPALVGLLPIQHCTGGPPPHSALVGLLPIQHWWFSSPYALVGLLPIQPVADGLLQVTVSHRLQWLHTFT